ncbi:hypothetical protein niasHT_037821 [Heterodera trifolii]|uniref:Cadherin domain-containing protein n=1 Tax=Heterodera trifolii TaxID=157864 RepID=A0ABD2IRM6_9BILA
MISSDPPTANLFLIDSHTGQIRMGRRPLDSERGREWVLNVLAVEGHGDRASSARTTAPASSTANDGTIEEEDEEEESAGGATNAKNRKNRKSRQTQQQQQKQGSKTKSNKELFNGVVEQAKAKLTANQALVLDRNDNLPQIEHLNVDGQIVFTVDWQLPVMGQVGRVGARDADEHAKLLYRLEQQQQQNANAAPMFAINETTGVITLIRSANRQSVCRRPLDSERGREWVLNVLAVEGHGDRASSARTTKVTVQTKVDKMEMGHQQQKGVLFERIGELEGQLQMETNGEKHL